MTREDVCLARQEWKDSCSSVICYFIATASLLLVGLALLFQSWTEWSSDHKVSAFAVFCLAVFILSIFSLSSLLACRVVRSHQAVNEKYEQAVAQAEADAEPKKVP